MAWPPDGRWLAYATGDWSNRKATGVRAALGADPGRLIRSVVTGGVRFVAIGIALGGVIAFFGSPAIGPLLYDTSPQAPPHLWDRDSHAARRRAGREPQPALRATRVQPSEALRAE